MWRVWVGLLLFATPVRAEENATAYEALRVIGNLCTPDGQLAPPETVKSVGVGTRVRMVFSDVSAGIALPQWTIDETAPQPDKPWRYAQE